MTKKSWSLVAGFVAFFAVGCGGDDKGGSDRGENQRSTTTAPKPAVDSRPRAEGRWRVVYTVVEGSSDEIRSDWTITPECPSGPCAARVVYKADEAKEAGRAKMRFDSAIGDYQIAGKFKDDCRDLTTNKLTFKNAYSSSYKTTLSVSAAVKAADGAVYATELAGERADRYALKPAAAEVCEAPENEKSSVRAVRVDKPTGQDVGPDGKPFPVVPEGTETASGE